MLAAFISSDSAACAFILDYSRGLADVTRRKQKEKIPTALKKIKCCFSIWLAGIDRNEYIFRRGNDI